MNSKPVPPGMTRSMIKLDPMDKKTMIKSGGGEVFQGNMGYGIKDSKELFRENNLYQIATSGMIKSQKQNVHLIAESNQLVKKQISKSTHKIWSKCVLIWFF